MLTIGVTKTNIWVADAAQDQDWGPPVSCGSRVLVLTMYVAHFGLFPVQIRYEVNIELQSIDIAPFGIQ